MIKVISRLKELSMEGADFIKTLGLNSNSFKQNFSVHNQMGYSLKKTLSSKEECFKLLDKVVKNLGNPYKVDAAVSLKKYPGRKYFFHLDKGIVCVWIYQRKNEGSDGVNAWQFAIFLEDRRKENIKSKSLYWK